MKLVECVPNVSEGKDRSVIDAIAQAVQKVNGVTLLNVDPGETTNRTVYTFVGPPEEVAEASFLLIQKAAELIDMRHHKGKHPRQGAVDVCPFVPISNVTMEECVALAKKLGKRVGDELGIPVYLYAEAATHPTRRRLPDLRAGEYEALEVKLKKPEWKPDFGPSLFNPKVGAIVIGARKFLIAYNVNLDTTDVQIAKAIAAEIRESGKKITKADGTSERIPGRFKQCQSDGWLIPEYHRAQVTINILDVDAAPLHQVFSACQEIAKKLGTKVTGSEIVGLVPEKVLVDVAIDTLGLSDITPFHPEEKIIEKCCSNTPSLIAMSLQDFTELLASKSGAPGGGSAAAAVGALAASLTSMVAALTHGKKRYVESWEEMERIGIRSQELMRELLLAVDADTAAFNRFLSAMALPQSTDPERTIRTKAIATATREATLVPLFVLEKMETVLNLADIAATKGNQNALSDAYVALLLARAAAHGALANVLINLKGMEDGVWAKTHRERALALIAAIDNRVKTLEETIRKIL